MKTYPKTSASIADCILDYMAEDGGRVNSEELCRVVWERVGVAKDGGSVKLVISTLVAAGRLEDCTAWKKRGFKYYTLATSTDTQTQPVVPDNRDSRIEELESLVSKMADAKPVDRVIAVETLKDGKPVSRFEDLFHARFEQILQLAEARMNIFIYGPTGCGKSHICEQVAKALGLSFSFVSCTAGMSEGVLGGRLLPTGDGGQFEYTISEFIKAYENGGVFLLDEIDAADPNVLLLINAALANGRVAVPNRPEKPYAERHEDFICVAAANTVGTGADRLYSGRNKLDAATLDRFQIGKVNMTYSDEVEEQLCPDEVLRSTLLRYRRAINANRLERAMSTRFMKDAFKMKSEFGWSQSQIDTAFFSGWREDEINKVQGHR